MQVVWKVALVAALFGCGDKDETEVMDDTAVVTTSTTEPTEPPRDVDHLQVSPICRPSWTPTADPSATSTATSRRASRCRTC